MSNKTISVYINKESLENIKTASFIKGRSVNNFITHYANQKAEEVIKNDKSK